MLAYFDASSSCFNTFAVNANCGDPLGARINSGTVLLPETASKRKSSWTRMCKSACQKRKVIKAMLSRRRPPWIDVILKSIFLSFPFLLTQCVCFVFPLAFPCLALPTFMTTNTSKLGPTLVEQSFKVHYRPGALCQIPRFYTLFLAFTSLGKTKADIWKVLEN